LAGELPVRAVDILILSNGPGEVATWVRPVVRELRRQLGFDRSEVRISVVLSPCPHATGKEAAIAGSYPEVDRVQEPQHFWPFLLWGKTAENWDWRDRGAVVFLGGDQVFPAVIGHRLGYRTVVYAEWEARWHRWIDRFAVMKPEIVCNARQKYAGKFAVVGDLMADVVLDAGNSPPTQLGAELIGLLPGSKPAKLAQGVPFCLTIAEKVREARPQTRFVIPVAPTLDLATLARFANPQHNPLIQKLGWGSAELVMPEGEIRSPQPPLKRGAAELATGLSLEAIENPKLVTPAGLEVELWTQTPAYNLLSQCRLCLTTVGANTAELGSLAVPMIVLIPMQQRDAMRAWDGIPGLLANLPGVGSLFAGAINSLVIRQGRLFAWPNIWAKQEIVPELVGELQPADVAQMVIDFLEHPEKLEEIRSRLRAVRGEPGASQKLAQLVREEILQ
jgi:lipid-A-disaccharide synthase